MLQVFDDSDKSTSLPLCDMHTHIGRVKIVTTKGESQRINQPQDIINLYEKLHYELISRVKQDQNNYLYKLPKAEKAIRPLFPVAESILSLNEKKKRGWLVDRIVTFPFNDIFHAQTQPKFVKSNRYVRHQVHTFDHMFRFAPFCRVDPTDENSPQEVTNSISLGMSGLKLHPLSQGWVDKIKSPETIEVLQIAGNLTIPVLFDVPNKGVALDITRITQEARLNATNPVNVILGHTGFDYSSPEIFDCLEKEGIFSETSGMRGKDVEIFFENVINVSGWDDKLLFGTDHNYFSVLQAADLITFLFSKRFHRLLEENNLTSDPLEVASKILGGNAFTILPVSWQKTDEESQSSEFVSTLKNFQQALKEFISKEGNYIKIDLASDSKTNSLIQVITFGTNHLVKSFIIHQSEDLQDIIFQPTHSKLEKPNFAEMQNYSVQSVKSTSSEETKLSQDELKLYFQLQE